jgi:hypothetical protein
MTTLHLSVKGDEVKQRPILFQGDMVRALLDGNKTQTRRLAKTEITMGLPSISGPRGGNGYSRVYLLDKEHDRRDVSLICPYGQPGDQLWVRESHWYFKDDHDPVTGYFPPKLTLDDFEYRADGESDRHGWYPSIHMPRIGSRITLEITSVRVERLGEISEADAMAEGIDLEALAESQDRYNMVADHNMTGRPTAIMAYRALWESINGPGSWDANPWVWVVSFRAINVKGSK